MLHVIFFKDKEDLFGVTSLYSGGRSVFVFCVIYEYKCHPTVGLKISEMGCTVSIQNDDCHDHEEKDEDHNDDDDNDNAEETKVEAGEEKEDGEEIHKKRENDDEDDHRHHHDHYVDHGRYHRHIYYDPHRFLLRGL